jgi:superfamily I DNA/RNA helicase
MTLPTGEFRPAISFRRSILVVTFTRFATAEMVTERAILVEPEGGAHAAIERKGCAASHEAIPPLWAALSATRR